MLASARALLTEIIDYAGLFPPARLELSEALDRYRRHSAGGEGWMLARFVVPATRLEELPPLLGGDLVPRPPIRLAVLGRSAASREGHATAISSDLADILSFVDRHADQATVEQLEIRLPDDPDQIAGVVEESLAQIRDQSPALTPFFEPSLLDRWPDRLRRTIDALGAAAGDGPVGLKVRCGGLDASAVPSPEALAAALAACQRARIPLKATQGLHQPVRHFDAGLATTAHGFLNLFFAGVLGHLHALSEQLLLAIAAEERAEAFRFHDSRLAWHDLAAGLDDIAATRRVAVTSFGSCSFSEPRDALRRLGLIEC
jgi:hypothetical protein